MLRFLRKYGTLTATKIILHEILFKFQYAVDTGGLIEITSKDAITENFKSAAPYQGVSVYIFRNTLKKLKNRFNVNLDEGHFVAYGCGKGKSMILAVEQGFPAVTGLDLSPELVKIASQNFSKLKTTRNWGKNVKIDLLVDDAFSYIPPSSANIFFLFNPFGSPVIEKVIDTIKIFSKDKKPEPVFVVYCNPVHGNLFEKSGFEKIMSLSNESNVYRYT